MYVDSRVVSRLKKAVFYAPTRFPIEEVVSTALPSAIRIIERHRYQE